MKLIKLKGIVIKEVPYKDNDKIITILTDSLGKISCLAKGSKKTNSPLLASSQYLVYSEFVLYKGTKFYHVNNASMINMFYDLRVDFDKLEIVFSLTKLISNVTDEYQDTSQILILFLNTIYLLQEGKRDKRLVITVFKIKLFCLLGFSPRIEKCSLCGRAFFENQKHEDIYYDYVSNVFLCNDCVNSKDKKRYINVSESTVVAIKYVSLTSMKKIFSFKISDIDNFYLFGQVFSDTMTNGI
jgi:DNA repair protein RecO (recombination protein O)